MNIKSTAKNEVKEVLNKLSIERKTIKIEKDLMQKELDSKIQDFQNMEEGIRQLKAEIEGKASKMKSMFESHLLKPFDDIWSVYKNLDQNSAIQLFMVFKMHASKIKDFVDFLANFKF